MVYDNDVDDGDDDSIADDDTDEHGVPNDDASGEFLQTGQVGFIFSHSSTQSTWKQWLHSGMVLMVSLGWYSDRQIGQVPSLGLGRRILSPSTVLG